MTGLLYTYLYILCMQETQPAGSGVSYLSIHTYIGKGRRSPISGGEYAVEDGRTPETGQNRRHRPNRGRAADPVGAGRGFDGLRAGFMR